MTNTATTTFPKPAFEILSGSGVTATEDNYGLERYSDLRNYFRNPNASATLNIANAPYIEFKLDFNVAKKIDFHSIVFDGLWNQYSKMQVRWSVDNFATSLGELPTGNAGSVLCSSFLSSLNNFIGTSVTFRVYCYAETFINGSAYIALGTGNYSSVDGTSINLSGRNVAIYVNSIENATPNITIVNSGGANEGTGWTYSNGVISPNTLYDVSINASAIQTKLSQGNLSIETNGNITISSSITSTNSNSLTFKAAGNIWQNSGARINTNFGDVTLWSDSDDSGQGGICIGSNTSSGEWIYTKGGNITLSGGANIATGYAKAATGFATWTNKPLAGITLDECTLQTSDASNSNNVSVTGNIVIRGAINNSVGNVTGRGVHITNAGVTAGVDIGGSGSITIEGDCTNLASSNSYGVFMDGPSYVETTNGVITIIGAGSTVASGARGIYLSGTVDNRPQIRSNTGNIIFTDKTPNTSSANYAGSYFLRPQIGGVYLNNGSTSNIIVNTDKITLDSDGGASNANGTNIDEQTQFETRGNVTIQSYSSSFTAAAEINRTYFSPDINTLTIGKSTNTSRIYIGAGLTPRRMGLSLNGTLVVNAKDIDFTLPTLTANKLVTNINSGGHVNLQSKFVVNEYRGYGLGCTISGTVNGGNEFKMIRLGTSTVPIKWVNIRNNGTLTLGDDSFGIYAQEQINFWTFNGDILINRTIKSDYSTPFGTNASITMQTDVSTGPKPACDTSIGGGNVKILRSSAQLIFNPNTQVRLFSSNPSLSTRLPQLTANVLYRKAPNNLYYDDMAGLPGIHIMYRADQVYPLASISAISGSTTLASDATTATYSVAPVSGATSYVWNLPAGMTRTSQTGTSVTVAISPTYTSGTITVKALNSCNETSLRSLTVRKAVATTFAVTGTPTLCPEQNQTYTATSVSAGAYAWTVPAGVTIVSGQGTSSIVVAATDNFTSGQIKAVCVTSGASLQATIGVGGVSQPSTITGPTSLCSLTTATYSVENTNGVSYVWNVPSGLTITSGQGTSSITVAVGSNVDGTISVRSQSSCGLSLPRYYPVNSSSVIGSISGVTRVCGSTEAVILANGTLSQSNPTNTYNYRVATVPGITTYTWTVPTGATLVSGQGSNSITVTFNLATFDSGLITVQGTTSCGVGAIKTLAVSTATGSISGPSTICSLTTATYSVPLDLGTNFEWSVPQGMSITSGAGTASITVAITHPMNFDNNNQVQVVYTSGCGVNKTLSTTIKCSEYTNLISSLCGASEITKNTAISANTVVGASGYRFRINGPGVDNVIVDRSTRTFYFYMVNGVTNGSTYSVEVAARLNGSYGVYGSPCNVTLESNPTTQLEASSCGATNVGMNTLVYANNVVGARGYKFRINGTGVDNVEIIQSNRYFKFSSVAGTSWGETYTVEVAFLPSDSDTYSNYGSSCMVSLENIPTTQLETASCSATNVTMNTAVNSNVVAGASGYKFRINGPGVDNVEVERADRWFYFYMVAGAVWGESYTVEVAVKAANGNYGAYGTSCSMTLGTPATSLATAQCGAIVNVGDRIYARTVTGATMYKFDIYTAQGVYITSVEKAYNYFYITEMQPPYTAGATYGVGVRVKQDGGEYGDQGSWCNITISSDEIKREVKDQGITSMTLKAYPNPFATTFTITALEGETATMFYQVYDVTGKMLESKSVEASEITNHTIGADYPVGMYLVIARQGATTQTFKMIKQ